MIDLVVLKIGIIGKKQDDFRIALNSASKDNEPCSICGENAGRLTGGSRKPVEIFGPQGIVCLKCSHSYAPELAEILDKHYEPGRHEGIQRSSNLWNEKYSKGVE